MIDFDMFIRQTISILIIYVVGYIFVTSISEKNTKKTTSVHFKSVCGDNASEQVLTKCVLAYPAGLSLYGLCGFLALVAGVPYNKITALVLPIIIMAASLIWGCAGKKGSSEKLCGNFIVDKVSLLFFAGFIILTIICCMGVIRVSVSNDSYYYYSLYPQTIALEGRYLTSFDVFLTDVGQTTAIINTIPWFYGFEETFGIQLMLAFNLITVFVMAIRDAAKGLEPKREKAVIAIFTALLLTATPFVVMSRWILANAYFMTFTFICMWLINSSRYEFSGCVALFAAMLSMTRMEGGMMAGLLVLCACVHTVENSFLLKYMLLPVGLTQLLYYMTIYLKLSVNPLYSFLDFKNAAVMLMFIAVIACYLLFIRGRRFLQLQSFYGLLLTGALILVNAILLCIDHSRYIGNLKFFWQNIILQNGWGYFGLMVFIGIILMPKQTEYRLSFPTLFVLEFVLLTFAVCFARDGSLRVGIGDSGNRVLMQIVPFVLLAFCTEYCRSGE